MRPLPAIHLPVGWNAEKNCEYFNERWHPQPSYAEALWRWMRFHYGCFDQALTQALRYLHERDATRVWIEPSCLAADEKIEILLGIAETSNVVAAYRPRLLDHLHACRFAESERRRIVRAHYLAGEQAWLYPVVEVIDYIGDAAFLLRETMMCENADYRQAGNFDPAGDDDD